MTAWTCKKEGKSGREGKEGTGGMNCVLKKEKFIPLRRRQDKSKGQRPKQRPKQKGREEGGKKELSPVR